MSVSVELRPVSELTPYARNARKHSDVAISRLASIIGEVGWTNPILVDESGIVAGHKRRLAALSIYAKGETIRTPGGKVLPAGTVPVLDVSGWTEPQRRAYILADNQTTLEGEWDLTTLRLELAWLQEVPQYDMALTGFDGDALVAALRETEIKDGYVEVKSGSDKAAGSMIIVGPYRFLVEAGTMSALLEDIRAEGDDDEDKIQTVILSRLGVEP